MGTVSDTAWSLGKPPASTNACSSARWAEAGSVGTCARAMSFGAGTDGTPNAATVNSPFGSSCVTFLQPETSAAAASARAALRRKDIATSNTYSEASKSGAEPGLFAGLDSQVNGACAPGRVRSGALRRRSVSRRALEPGAG